MSALRWADIADSTDGDGILITVRRSKTNQEGEVNDWCAGARAGAEFLHSLPPGVGGRFAKRGTTRAISGR